MCHSMPDSILHWPIGLAPLKGHRSLANMKDLVECPGKAHTVSFSQRAQDGAGLPFFGVGFKEVGLL